MKKTKFFKATFAPHEGAEDVVQRRIDTIEADGGDIMSVDVEGSSAYIVAKFDTATQGEADNMVASGEAQIPNDGKAEVDLDAASEGNTAQAPAAEEPKKRGGTRKPQG